MELEICAWPNAGATSHEGDNSHFRQRLGHSGQAQSALTAADMTWL